MHTYNHEDIARYTTGEMTGTELQTFEEVLAQDRALQESVAAYRDVLHTLQYKLVPDEQDAAFKATLRTMNGEYFGGKKTKVVPLYKWIGGAVAAAVVLLMIWLQPWGQQDLYQQYAQVQMVAAAERGNETDTLLQQATLLFNQGNYAGAQPYLEAAIASQPANALTSFYYAVTLIATNEPVKARALLAPIYEGTSVVKYDAAFFMALSYLKEKDVAACRQWLEKIPEGTSRYAAAQELLKKI
jgi:tetratricopeptide (TPR) repeat protein